MWWTNRRDRRCVAALLVRRDTIFLCQDLISNLDLTRTPISAASITWLMTTTKSQHPQPDTGLFWAFEIISYSISKVFHSEFLSYNMTTIIWLSRHSCVIMMISIYFICRHRAIIRVSQNHTNFDMNRNLKKTVIKDEGSWCAACNWNWQGSMPQYWKVECRVNDFGATHRISAVIVPNRQF